MVTECAATEINNIEINLSESKDDERENETHTGVEHTDGRKDSRLVIDDEQKKIVRDKQREALRQQSEIDKLTPEKLDALALRIITKSLGENPHLGESFLALPKTHQATFINGYIARERCIVAKKKNERATPTTKYDLKKLNDRVRQQFDNYVTQAIEKAKSLAEPCGILLEVQSYSIAENKEALEKLVANGMHLFIDMECRFLQQSLASKQVIPLKILFASPSKVTISSTPEETALSGMIIGSAMAIMRREDDLRQEASQSRLQATQIASTIAGQKPQQDEKLLQNRLPRDFQYMMTLITSGLERSNALLRKLIEHDRRERLEQNVAMNKKMNRIRNAQIHMKNLALRNTEKLGTIENRIEELCDGAFDDQEDDDEPEERAGDSESLGSRDDDFELDEPKDEYEEEEGDDDAEVDDGSYDGRGLVPLNHYVEDPDEIAERSRMQLKKDRRHAKETERDSHDEKRSHKRHKSEKKHHERHKEKQHSSDSVEGGDDDQGENLSEEIDENDASKHCAKCGLNLKLDKFRRRKTRKTKKNGRTTYYSYSTKCKTCVKLEEKERKKADGGDDEISVQ